MGVRLPCHASPDHNDTVPNDRHFVLWTEKEDRVLRDQVRLLGTDKWPMIAAHLANKTGRQCRRRWQLCLNVPSKKGGWTLEEDRVLFEAHQKHGNRWTEIAKVLPGRTDNAVKNRFTSLIRKHAKESECSQTESSGDVGSDLKQQVHKRRGSDNFSDSNTSKYSHGSSKKARCDGHIQALTPDSVLQQNWRGFMSGPFASPISEGTVHYGDSKHASLFYDQQPNSRVYPPFNKSWKDMEWLIMNRNHPSGGINSHMNSSSDGAVSHGPKENDASRSVSGPNSQNRPVSAPDNSCSATGLFSASPDPCAYQRSSMSLRTWDHLPSTKGQRVRNEQTAITSDFVVKHDLESIVSNEGEDHHVKKETKEPPAQHQGRDSVQGDDSIEMKQDISESPEFPGSPPRSSHQSLHTPLSLTPSSRHLMDGMPSPQFSDMERQFLLSALEGCQLSVLESPLNGQVESPCLTSQPVTNKKIRGPLLDASYDTPCRSPLSSYLLQSYQESPVAGAIVAKLL